MKALWMLSLIVISTTTVAAAAGTSTKKPVSKKDNGKKENLNGSELHKKLFLEASNVKKAIAERSEAAQADQSGIFHRLKPVKEAVALQNQKATEKDGTLLHLTQTKDAAAIQRLKPSKGVLSFPIFDFSSTPHETTIEEEAVTTEEPHDHETDMPVLLSRSALMELLNISGNNLDKELKTITVGSTGITIGGFDPFQKLFAGPGTGTGIIVGTDTITKTGTKGGITKTGTKGGLSNAGLAIAFPDFANKPLLGIIGGGNKDGLAATLTTLFAIAAAIGAGLASLIAFVVPPLQIANQVLAIIAISLLIAYVVHDKKGAEETDYEYMDSGYGSEPGYGYDMGSGLVSFGDTTGYSSYSNYRRSDALKPADAFSDLLPGKTIDGVGPMKSTTLNRSVGLVPMVNSVTKAVTRAINSYSNMYGENPSGSA
ncbi:hypothetical protein FHG87_006117 [Trinorchestia longiramus]|nr:hypothetical protein FHG87_006117 [Trinorchestia longiramus]